MKYNDRTADAQSVARFGDIETPRGAYELPASSVGVRTRNDVESILELMAADLSLRVVTPYVSCSRSLKGLEVITRPEEVSTPRPLVIPDPESEALSFNCTARNNYFGPPSGRKVGRGLVELTETGLSGDTKVGRREVHAAWKYVSRKYTYRPVAEWAATQQAKVASDVFLAPTPIIKDDPEQVNAAFDAGEFMVAQMEQDRRFSMRGIHLLLHSALFRPTPEAATAKAMILKRVKKWEEQGRMGDTILSIKVHDANNYLHDTEQGSINRQNLSAFISDLRYEVERVGGLLVIHNVGNWVIGCLDSGADVAVFRVSGPARIDVPMKGTPGKRGKRPPPGLILPRVMAEVRWEDLQAEYERTKAYRIPALLEPEPYWTWDSATEREVFAKKVKVATMFEMADEYRAAGLNPAMPLAEAMRSLIADSEIRQELMDLSPSARHPL